MTKSEKIRESLSRTKDIRQRQVARTYVLKLEKLSRDKRKLLERAFLEAKWLYNWTIHQEDVFSIDGNKVKKVHVKVGEDFEERELTILGSQVRQEIADRIKDSIKALSRLKENGMKVGRLKPKKRVKSIPFKQYGVSHKIDFEKKRVHLQKLGSFKVRGLNQTPENAELTKALLVRKPSGYYVHITCYLPKENRKSIDKPIAIDFGVKDKLTLSNGLKIDFEIPESKRLKRLQKELVKKEKGSKNREKTRQKLAREYERINNRRKDAINKIIAFLKFYSLVIFQDDSVKSWHEGLFSREVQYSGIGKLKERLCSSLLPVLEVDRFELTSRVCSKCGAYFEDLRLSDRTVFCPECGNFMDRDLNACLVMLKKVSPALRVVGQGLPELTPVEREASARILGSNPHIRVSYLVEAGSSMLYSME